MADEPEVDEELSEIEDAEDEQPPEAETDDGGEAEAGEVDDDGEIDVIDFGEGAAPAPREQEADWLKALRKQNRELARENARLKSQAPAEEKPVEVGPKPTLADHDYDEAAFDTAYDAWKQRKAEADRQAQAAEESRRKAQEAWQSELQAFEQQKAKLPRDAEEAHDEVATVLSPTQLAMLIGGAEQKAALIYALGRNPERLKSLSQIQDPVKFAFAAGRLEKEIRVQKRTPNTQPETVVRGSAPRSGSTDTTLARLEAEADRTGDRTKVVAYRKALKAKAGNQ